MKKLITLLAIVGFVPCVHAAEGADFSHSGDYRLKYTNSVNKDFNKSGSITAGESDPQVFEQRLKLGTDVRAGEKLSTHFTFVHNATWGENPTQVPESIDTTNGTGKNLLLVNEAYMTWMASDAWMLRAGRGSFTMADGSVISANDYEAVSNAFDGVMASYDHEMARISAFGVKGGATSEINDDRIFANFWGLSVDFKSLPSFLKALNVHYMMVKVDEGNYGVAVPNEDSSRLGVTASGDMAGFDYKFTYAAWSGDHKVATGSAKQDISSSMMDAHLGYSLPSMMNSNFHVGFHSDTGSKNGAAGTNTKDETYQGFYYDRHFNAGLMDVVSWGNLTYMTFGASFHPSDDITVGADMYTFTQTEKSDDNYTGTGKAVVSAGPFAAGNGMGLTDANKDAIGTELDLTVNKKYTNNFNISARYGTFSPGDELKAVNMKDTYTQMSVAANLKF